MSDDFVDELLKKSFKGQLMLASLPVMKIEEKVDGKKISVIGNNLGSIMKLFSELKEEVKKNE